MLLWLLALHGVADGFVVWYCRWKITEKVSFITIVSRKYQASQMPSSTEPQLARDP